MNMYKLRISLVFCAGILACIPHLFAQKKIIKVSNDEFMTIPYVKRVLSGSRSHGVPENIDALIAGPIMESILAVAYAKTKQFDQMAAYKQAVASCTTDSKKLLFGVPCKIAWFTLISLAHSSVEDEVSKVFNSLSNDELKKIYDTAPKIPHELEAVLIKDMGIKNIQEYMQESVVREVLTERFMQKMLDDARAEYDIQFEPTLRDVFLNSIQDRLANTKEKQRWLADKKRMEELDKE